MNAPQIAEMLGLQPHPEGGCFAETWRHDGGDERGAGTAIYYLLRAGEVSHWHRVDATEIFHFYAGASLAMQLSPDGAGVTEHVLGADLGAGQVPQLVVPPGCWQTAWSLGDWTLVGCTVSPAFVFEGFELAPAGWNPANIAAGSKEDP